MNKEIRHSFLSAGLTCRPKAPPPGACALLQPTWQPLPLSRAAHLTGSPLPNPVLAHSGCRGPTHHVMTAAASHRCWLASPHLPRTPFGANSHTRMSAPHLALSSTAPSINHRYAASPRPTQTKRMQTTPPPTTLATPWYPGCSAR
jgi:hypothetical protein